MPSIRLIKHEAVPKCGSYEVRYSDGRPSHFFYWDDIPGRRLNPALVDGQTALERAKAVARTDGIVTGVSEHSASSPVATVTASWGRSVHANSDREISARAFYARC
jgi:hypothetical protein